MTNKHLFVISALLLLLVINVDARKLSFTKIECLEHNNDVCGELACTLGKKQKSLNLGCTMKRATNEMIFHGKMMYTNSKMKTPSTMEGRGDFCDVVNGRIDSAAINMGRPLMKTFLPQFARDCPYSGRLEITNFDPNEVMAMFPPVTPPGNYTAELELFNDRNELVIHPKVSFTVKK